MKKITITPAAENDLIGIWVYIAKDNPDAADRVYFSASETFKTLLEFPEMGTLHHHKRKLLEGIRFFPIRNYPCYIVYYRREKDGIKIIRVLHSRMKKKERLYKNF